VYNVRKEAPGVALVQERDEVPAVDRVPNPTKAGLVQRVSDIVFQIFEILLVVAVVKSIGEMLCLRRIHQDRADRIEVLFLEHELAVVEVQVDQLLGLSTKPLKLSGSGRPLNTPLPIGTSTSIPSSGDAVGATANSAVSVSRLSQLSH
jgi:hypothetical protein